MPNNIDNNLTENDIFIVGYGGWVKVDRYKQGKHYENFQHDSETQIKKLAERGTILQVTGADVSRQTNLPTVTSYYLPYHEDKETNRQHVRSPMLLGKGTYTFSGNISFELTYGALEQFINDAFFKRDTIFTLSFFDGQNTCIVANCVWSNFQIQCSPNNLVTASITYQSNNGYVDDLQIFRNDADTEVMYDEEDLLVPYWTCGHEGFQEFTISFERPVTPVFLNGDLHVASYLRPGLISVSLSATTIEYRFEEWEKELDICLGTRPQRHGIKLLKSLLQSCQYSMSSMTDIGAKTYAWNSISEESHEHIFEIY